MGLRVFPLPDKLETAHSPLFSRKIGKIDHLAHLRGRPSWYHMYRVSSSASLGPEPDYSLTLPSPRTEIMGEGDWEQSNY